MSTLKTISAALKLVETKKENLKKAYDDLQVHSSLLSSFPLTWSFLDSHFTSIHNSLTQRFHLLEQQSHNHNNPSNNDPLPSSSQLPHPNPKDANFSSFPNNPTTQNGTSALPNAHGEELSALCKKMDGKGLRNYIGEHLKDKSSIRVELQSALKCANDPAAMVLDSMNGVIGANAVKDGGELRRMKRGCSVLFQQLRVACPNVSAKVRKRAKKLAAEWKGSLVSDNADAVGAMAFLHFVAAYGLLSELNMNELATFSAMAAANDELPELYQIIGLTDKVPGLVQKLIDKGKYILAVKYVFEFNLADRIPPVPILQAYVNESQKLARRLSQEGKSLNEITAREIHALKSVIKVIENHNLESAFPHASLEQRIEQLKKHKANVKHAAPASAARSPQHQQQQSGIKRPRTSASVGPAAILNNVSDASSTMHQYQQVGPAAVLNNVSDVSSTIHQYQQVGPAAVLNNVSSASSTIHQYQQPLLQPTGLLSEHPNPYMSLPAMPFGMVAPNPTISPYKGPSTGPYGLDGVPMGPSGKPGQGGSHANSSEPHALSGYYDSVSAYGGYGLQHYYQTSYPQ